MVAEDGLQMVSQYDQRADTPSKGDFRPRVQSLAENSDLDDEVVLNEAQAVVDEHFVNEQDNMFERSRLEQDGMLVGHSGGGTVGTGLTYQLTH